MWQLFWFLVQISRIYWIPIMAHFNYHIIQFTFTYMQSIHNKSAKLCVNYTNKGKSNSLILAKLFIGSSNNLLVEHFHVTSQHMREDTCLIVKHPSWNMNIILGVHFWRCIDLLNFTSWQFIWKFKDCFSIMNVPSYL